ncbi:MAG: exodeoxyribonuclease III [Cryomorphaceae bacterium]|nr:exodeoxyribonuclease III [Flavobacteriales bacterium]
MKLKIISYNVNGIRAAVKKGLMEWLADENPDIFLVQETKAKPEQIDLDAFAKQGYTAAIHSAEKSGYSGVAIFSKMKPDHVEVGCGIEKYDREGRVLRADFGELSVLSTYFPSGSSGDERQEFKMEFLNDFKPFAKNLAKQRRKVVISGDYNICHKPIDIHNPVSNKKSSGFLPEEREWVTEFLSEGFLDSFRHFHEDEPDRYSWWTYRFSARQKNLGWRIDYHMVSEALKSGLIGADILENVHHSDHCPVKLNLEI